MYRRPVLSKAAAQALALGKNGSYGNEGNVLEHVLYDTNDFANTTMRVNTQFFTQPIGAAYGGGVKGRHETNMQEPSRLPTGQTMLVTAVSLAFKAWLVGADTDRTPSWKLSPVSFRLLISGWLSPDVSMTWKYRGPFSCRRLPPRH